MMRFSNEPMNDPASNVSGKPVGLGNGPVWMANSPNQLVNSAA